MPDTNVALSIGTPEIRCMEDHTPGRTKDVTRITRPCDSASSLGIQPQPGIVAVHGSGHHISQWRDRLSPRTVDFSPSSSQAEVSDPARSSEQYLQNRRKYVRVPMRAQVICIADTLTLRGVTWNLSQNGIQVELPELKKKAKVQLTFRLPVSGTIIDALGAVVWRLERRHGIKFRQVGDQSQESIRRFIEQQQVRDRGANWPPL
jgi:PilZ domain